MMMKNNTIPDCFSLQYILVISIQNIGVE